MRLKTIFYTGVAGIRSFVLMALFTQTSLAQIEPLRTDLVGRWDEQPVGYLYADLWADDRNIAYVGSFSNISVDILDISNPANPTLITNFSPPELSGGGSHTIFDIKVHEGLMYINGGIGAHIVDVRDPANPTYLVDIVIPDMNIVHNLFYHSGYLYLVDSQSPQIAIVDLTNFNPDATSFETIIQDKWFMENVGASLVHDITVIHDRLYVSAWDSGLIVYDVSDVAHQPPVFLASAPGDNTHSAWPTSDGRWIVTDEERNNGGPVKLYELIENEEGTSLIHRYTFSIPTTEAISSHNVYVVGHRVYCAWYNRGLMVFNINAQSKSLELIAHYDTSTVNPNGFSGMWGVYPFLGRDRVLASDLEEGFWIFDIHIPGSGDYNGDADRDLQDYSSFLTCFGTDGLPYSRSDCNVFDFDNDNDVDIDDYSTLFSGLMNPLDE